MSTTRTETATMRACSNCQGEGRVDTIRTINRGADKPVISRVVKEPCGACKGSGRVMVDGAPARYFMRQNMTDGSVAVMATSASPWQVIKGRGGKDPSPNEPSLAADFTRAQNALRERRVQVGLAAVPAVIEATAQ